MEETYNALSAELVEQILGLLDTACQGSLELLRAQCGGEWAAAEQLLADLRAVTRAVDRVKDADMPRLKQSYIPQILGNISDTLDEIERSARAGDRERAAEKTEFQLFPFFRQLREMFYFWGTVCPDKARMREYYRDEFAAHYQNLYWAAGNPPACRASVVVVAYNHVEMTRQCVESVLMHTDFDALNAELVLVDHGSTDGTLEYFESLGVGRVIHYQQNLRGTMFCALPQICPSEFYVHVANDTVVTKDWLKLLLECMDADPRIALACPATCNLSNLQAIHVPTDDCGELVRLAELRNCSDPRLWRDRARVLPAIGVFRMQALNEIGFWDPFFYTFDYMDDDFSLRARRHGYRQILCENIWCYHRGSATVKADQQKERTLEEGRRLFREKHGVDAWGPGFCYDFHLLQNVIPSGEGEILAIDCGFGDNALQLRNLLRETGRDAEIYHLTTDEAYLPDLQPHAAGVEAVPPGRLALAVAGCFPGAAFSHVCMGRGLSAFPEPYALLEAIANRVAPGGQVLLSFENPYFALRLHQMLQFSVPEASLQLLPPERVVEQLRRWFSSVTVTGVRQPVHGLEEFLRLHYGEEFAESGAAERLSISNYYVNCIK